MDAQPAPALFLDRDGVINHEVGYLYRREDVRWVAGFHSLARTAQQLGYRLVVVTNQSGIARGFYTHADFDALMDWMREELARDDVHLDAVYCCPFHPEHGVGEWKRESDDRKPSPGMLHRAARDHHLDLARSIMVGDRWSDIAAANAAGLEQAFLLEGTEAPASGPGSTQPAGARFLAVGSLAEVENWMQARATAAAAMR